MRDRWLGAAAGSRRRARSSEEFTWLDVQDVTQRRDLLEPEDKLRAVGQPVGGRQTDSATGPLGQGVGR